MKIIQLTELNPQKWETLFWINILRKPTTYGPVSVDSSKITYFGECAPEKSSPWHRTDFPVFTEIHLVGGKVIHVKESRVEVEKLILD